MSAEIGIGDVLRLSIEANRLKHKWSDAPTEYRTIIASHDISAILCEIASSNLLSNIAHEQATILCETYSTLINVLISLDSLAEKYSTLRVYEFSSGLYCRRLWRKPPIEATDVNDVEASLALNMALVHGICIDALRNEDHNTRDSKEVPARNQVDLAMQIYSAYDDVRKHINQGPEQSQKLAYEVMMWINHSAERLTIRQLQHALAIVPGRANINNDSDLVDAHYMLSVCLGLVTVDPKSNIVQLIHPTLHKYLDQQHDLCFGDVYAFMATKCIDYLLMDSFGRYNETESTSDKPEAMEILTDHDFCGYIFLEHATRFWGIYALRSPDQALIERLCLKLHAQPQHWRTFCKLLSCHCARQHAWWREDVSLLHVTACFGFLDFAQKLLDSGHDARSKDDRESTPLMWAVTYGKEDMFDLFFSNAQIDPNLEKDCRGMTLLICAAQSGHVEIVKFLLQLPGIDPNISSYDGTALTCAVSKGHVDVVEALLSHPDVDTKKRDHKDWSLMNFAAFYGQTEILKVLLERLPPDAADWKPGCNTPLHDAAAYGNVSTLQLLLKHTMAELNALDEDGCTPLVRAAEKNQTEVVRYLLSQPQIVSNSQDKHGQTALMRAVKGFASPDFENVSLLVNYPGIDINLQDKNGHSALIYALLHNRSFFEANNEILNLLLSKPDIQADCIDRFGYTPLHHAIMKLDNESARILLRRSDVSPMSVTFDGHTPMSLILEQHRVLTARQRLRGSPADVIMWSCCGPREPHTVVITSPIEPNFSLKFDPEDFVFLNFRVQDVWRALAERWEVDERYLRLQQKGINLTIGWDVLEMSQWDQNEIIHAEIMSERRSPEYTQQEIDEQDRGFAGFVGTTWEALWARLTNTVG